MASNMVLKLPDDLMSRFRSIVPNRQRTRVIASLLESEVKRREQALERVAAEVEADAGLKDEMADWETTVADGIDDEVPDARPR
jgi:hypothetical protein